MTQVWNRCAILLVSCLVIGGGRPVHGERVADFEGLQLADNSYENGENLEGSFTTGGVQFPNEYKGNSWSGWSYSNVDDTTTPGWGNQYAAFALPRAHGPNTYAVASAFSPVTVSLPGAPLSVDIANTTYAARSVLFGDSFAKEFGGPSGNDDDFFRLTISGKDSSGDSTGEIPFYLADYRFPDKADEIVRDWKEVDLSDLGAETRTLEFALESSDVGQYGMNTPAYFAVDNLTTAPEPGSFFLLGMALMAGFGVYRLRTVRHGARS